MRNDEVLGTTQTTAYDTIWIGQNSIVYFQFKVYKVDASEVETLIFSSSVGFRNGVNGSGISYTTGICPETSLDPTDHIRVKCYIEITDSTPDVLKQTFNTEDLGASKLDSATWTFYAYFFIVDYGGGSYSFNFRYGKWTTDSRIENFSWTSAPVGIASKRLLVGVGV